MTSGIVTAAIVARFWVQPRADNALSRHRHPSRAVSEFRKHIPNLVSLSRLVLAAAFPFLDTIGRIWLCVLAAISDILDGAIARRLNVNSPFGNVVDPVADKIFVVVAFATFIFEGFIGPWEVTAILLRDFAVVAAVIVLLAQRRPEVVEHTHSRVGGKATTVLQFAVFAALLLWGISPFALIVATGIVSFIAGVDYLHHYYRVAEEMREEPA